MTEQNLPLLSFAGMQDYTAWAGGNHGFVPQEGYFKVRIDSCEPKLAKDGIKGLVQVGCSILDTDVGMGTPLISRVIYSGVDGKGNPMVRQFCDFLHSTGTPEDAIQNLGKTAANSDIRASVQQLIGREAFVQIRFEEYNGQMQSNISSWVGKEVYDKQASGGGHRGRKAENVSIADLRASKQPATQQVALGGPAAPPVPGQMPGMMPGAGVVAAPPVGAAPSNAGMAPAAPAGHDVPHL